MRTAILTIKKDPPYRRAAFEAMLTRHGYKIASSVLWPNTPAPQSREDLLVLWNKKRGKDQDDADRWERQGGTVLVVENGYLQKVDKTYYAISVHGHNGSGWFPVGDEDRFTKLGFELKDWHERTETTHVLVCGQRGIGSSLMASPPMWAEKHCMKLDVHKGLRVRIRPHPGNFAPKVPIERDLANAHACHIWSSGAGVRALVEGVEVKHFAPFWICDRPANRVDQLHRMSHGQWHHEEIATGEPLARILAHLKEAKWG